MRTIRSVGRNVGVSAISPHYGSSEDHLCFAIRRLEKLRSPASEALYLSLLKSCSKLKDLSLALRIRTHLLSHGLDLAGFLGENVLATLCKCRALDDSLAVFNRLPRRTVFAWTALLTCLLDDGRPNVVFSVYRSMLKDGVEPDSYTFVTLFKACGLIADLELAKVMHDDARAKGFMSDIFVGNSLISMYGKCGAVVEAENVFMGLARPDIVSCNALISVYVEQGEAQKALCFFRQIHQEAMVVPDEHTIMFTLQATRIYAEMEEGYFKDGPSPMEISLEIAEALHADALKQGFSSNKFVGNTLMSVYGICGTARHVMNAFHGIFQPDIVSWTALLSAFLEQHQPEKVLQLYIELPQDDLQTNHQTFMIALQACGSLAESENAVIVDGMLIKAGSLSIGRAVHVDVLGRGLETSLFVGNTLLSMYGKCGVIADAEKVFSGLSNSDLVTWNAMLSAYVEHGESQKALLLYRQMQEEGMHPNRQTFMTILQACDNLEWEENSMVGASLDICQALHSRAWKRGLASDVFVGTTLIKMYGKCGNVPKAENAFSGICHHDIVSCTALLSVYVDQGEDEKAFLFYRWMQENIALDDITLSHVLQVCRRTGMLEISQQIHFLMVCSGVDSSVMAGNTLVHAYSGFANMSDARMIFDGILLPDSTAWNACIAGYAGIGSSAASLQMFEEMRIGSSITPDGATFSSLLSACNHAGLVDIGTNYFVSMSSYYHLTKDISHYVLWVDLLGRAGNFVRAQNVVDGVPKHAILATCLCLLSACQTHVNVDFAKFAFKHVVDMQSNDAAAYVLMSNICINRITEPSA